MKVKVIKLPYIGFANAERLNELIGYNILEVPFGYVTKFYEPKTAAMRSMGMRGRNAKKLYYAPLQQLLVDWLYEEYRTHIEIKFTRGHFGTNFFHYKIHLIGDTYLNRKLEIFSGTKTFYEKQWCIEEALQVTLDYLLEQKRQDDNLSF